MGAARLAAERRTDEDLERLDRLLAERGEMPPDGDLTAFAQRDVAFHTAIARASHNAGLEELYRYFATSARLHTHALMLELERDVPGADAEAHANILSAIERRDPDQAAKAVQDTMTSIMMRLAELDRT
jgi:DNA-binding FadR family transcriptional regulator